MPTFALMAEVEQVVVKRVSLIVTAKNKQEAINKAHGALATYPDPVFEDGVSRMLTIKQSYAIPTSIAVTDVSAV
jgi:hypothetical protein